MPVFARLRGKPRGESGMPTASGSLGRAPARPPGRLQGMVSKGEPLAEAQEAAPPKGPWGGFQGKALTVFLQTLASVA